VFDSEDFEAFQEEAQAHLALLEQGLMALEDPRGGTLETELLNDMFRGAHSIKGSAGLLGWKRLADLTHLMESLLHGLRSGKTAFSPEIADALFEAVDILRTLLIEGPESTLDIKATLATLKAVQDAGLPAKAAAAAKARRTGPLAYADTLLADSVSPEDAAALEELAAQNGYLYQIRLDLEGCVWADDVIDHLALEKLRTIARILAMQLDAPAPGPESGPFEIHGRALAMSTAEPILLDMLIPLPKGAIVQIYGPGLEALVEGDGVPAGDPLRSSRPLLDPNQTSPADAYAEAGPGSEPPDPRSTELSASRRRADNSQGPERQGKQGVRMDQHAPPKGQSIRVGVEKLDQLMDIVGELVIANTRIAQLGAELGLSHERDSQVTALTQTLGGVGRLMADLQDLVMQIRMIPVERVFSKFPRLVRDLSQKLGKDIRLEISGEDTELDKTLVEELEDPLVHLLRNAADHGVEPPDVRESRNKPRTGIVRLSASREGNRIVITIADDGGGIDPGKILKKALTQGLAAPGVDYTESEILQFILQPGFSTAETVTDVSGRGVGMDVVNQNIRKIKGSLHIQSRPGEGTRFVIKLPLTLAITKALLVGAGGDQFAIPIDVVRESIRVREADIGTVNRREVIRLRDEVIPLIRLPQLLHLADRRRPSLPVVVVENDNASFGLGVDRLEGERDIVMKSLGAYLGELPGIAGATILGDGRIALVLDTVSLALTASSSPAAGAAS
jgi:two-component system chemotaxis sensor kinase CheA